MNTETSNDLLLSVCSNAQKRPSPSSAFPLKLSSSSYHDDHSICHSSRGTSDPHPCASSSAITPTPTKKQRLVSADDGTTSTSGADVGVGADADAVEAATALAAIGMPRRPVPMTHAYSQAQAPSKSLQRENLENKRWTYTATSTIHSAPMPLPPYSSHLQQPRPVAGSNRTVSHVKNLYSERQQEQIIKGMSTTFIVPPPSSKKRAHRHDGAAINSFACASSYAVSETGFTNLHHRAPFSSVMSNGTNPHDAPLGGTLPPPPRHLSFALPPASAPITPQQEQEQYMGDGRDLVAQRVWGSASCSVREQGTLVCFPRVPCATVNHATAAGAGGGTSVGRGVVAQEQASNNKAKPLPAMIVNDHSMRATTPAERRDDNAVVGTTDDFVTNVGTTWQEGLSGGAIRRNGSGISLARGGTQSQSRQLRWFPGHTSLALPGDDDVLSPLHCFMRRYCVEAFSATADDVCQPRYGKSHGNRVSIGQVGIRCLHCRSRPAHERADRAVCYPSTIKNIYHSMETWQRRHSALCRDIPPWVRERMSDLVAASRSGAGGRRLYWVDAAVRLGLVDTTDGVRFGRDPFSDEFRHRRYDGGAPEVAARGESSPRCSRGERSTSGLASATAATTTAESSGRIVSPDDKALVNEHLYLLMEQMEPCRFSEADQTGGRSKVKDLYMGYPGLQCRHCQGKAGFGRYFPSSVANLTLANSDRNIHNHMMKCRKCPAEVKSSLNSLQRGHAEEGGKSKRGSRKIFFTRIWTKLHPGDDGLV